MTALEQLFRDLSTPPHNIEAEQCLIGAVLLNNDVFRRVSTIVEAEHFFVPEHVEIWLTVAAMANKGHAATPVTLKDYLSGEPILGMGQMAYLAHLAAQMGTVSNAKEYARTIHDLYARRQVIEGALQVVRRAQHAPVDATAESIFNDLETHVSAARPVIGDAATDFEAFGDIPVDEVYEAYRNGGADLIGLSTGIPRLDDLVGGLAPSDLIIIGGRPAMGKTALATGIAVAIARRAAEDAAKLGGPPKPVCFSSLEMSGSQLKQRVLAGMAGVSSRKLRRGSATGEEIKAFANAEADFRHLPLHIDHTGGLTIAQLKLRVRSFAKKRGGISLLVIDYLQLLSGTSKTANRTQELTEITTGLKALAKELEIPIIALSQLSRSVEERDNKRPVLKDLRESGSIEQDADIVMFVYREEYYLVEGRPRDNPEAEGAWFAKMNRWKGIGEVIVAKNRHDSVGSVELGFEGQHTRFTNEPEWRSPDPEEARKTAKRIVLSPHGKALKEILHELAVSIGRRPTQSDRTHKPALPAAAMLIDRDEVKKLFIERVVVDLNEAEQRRKLQSAADNLRNADLTANFTDATGRNWVYLVELIAE